MILLAVKIVDIFIWHAADITTQPLCIGIAGCQPLHKTWLHRVAEHIESNNTGKNRQDSTYGARKAAYNIALRTTGGGVRDPASNGATSDKKPGGVAHCSSKHSSNIRGDLVLQSDDSQDRRVCYAYCKDV